MLVCAIVEFVWMIFFESAEAQIGSWRDKSSAVVSADLLDDQAFTAYERYASTLPSCAYDIVAAASVREKIRKYAWFKVL